MPTDDTNQPIIFYLPWYCETNVKQVFPPDSQFLYATNHNLFRWRLNGISVVTNEDSVKPFMYKYRYVLQRFKESTPILARHYDFMPFQEDTLRRLALVTLSLANTINSYSPSFVYFGYESSHHLNSLTLEIAAEISNIPQLFEFPLTEDGGILFLRQDKDESRAILNASERLNSYYPDPIDFFNRSYVAKAEKSQSSIFTRFSVVIFWVISSTLYHRLRNRLKQLGETIKQRTGLE